MKHLFLAACTLVLFSCDEKKASLQSQDPKSRAQVLVTAEKEGMGEPFLVNIQIKADSLRESVGTEIYAGDLDSTNVHFDWQEPGVCLVTFHQQDNTERKILAVVVAGKVGLKEVGAE